MNQFVINIEIITYQFFFFLIWFIVTRTKILMVTTNQARGLVGKTVLSILDLSFWLLVTGDIIETRKKCNLFQQCNRKTGVSCKIIAPFEYQKIRRIYLIIRNPRLQFVHCKFHQHFPTIRRSKKSNAFNNPIYS